MGICKAEQVKYAENKVKDIYGKKPGNKDNNVLAIS
jgi:hypothetical protein